ncbi:hypothetical protein BpHYR1_002704 [Brachionus plicatilis]|uniref:Uncharacterized protein n=1 Tax=Brachionus plicatilis TaxID=10195 RepID=A0A3M7QHM5_BRAPC|nr:hypothetical protein BpHYR1_002704 [Brachionus plicatilis]
MIKNQKNLSQENNITSLCLSIIFRTVTKSLNFLTLLIIIFINKFVTNICFGKTLKFIGSEIHLLSTSYSYKIFSCELFCNYHLHDGVLSRYPEKLINPLVLVENRCHSSSVNNTSHQFKMFSKLTHGSNNSEDIVLSTNKGETMNKFWIMSKMSPGLLIL